MSLKSKELASAGRALVEQLGRELATPPTPSLAKMSQRTPQLSRLPSSTGSLNSIQESE
eukprot:gene30896-38730_t